MRVTDPAPTEHAGTTRRGDGNGIDLHYLELALAALGPAMATSHAATVRATGDDVRTLAREALSQQTRQLAAVSACLHGRDDREAAGPEGGPHAGLPGLHGPALDRAFVVQLTDHAHISMTAARAEMVGGASARARKIAEDSIRMQCRHLAALEQLAPPPRV